MSPRGIGMTISARVAGGTIFRAMLGLLPPPPPMATSRASMTMPWAEAVPVNVPMRSEARSKLFLKRIMSLRVELLNLYASLRRIPAHVRREDRHGGAQRV